eukprot:Gb_13994 [translate_table: standard]
MVPHNHEASAHVPAMNGERKGDDPNSPYDWAMLSVAIAFTVPFILANCAIIRNRKKNYFRALGGVDLIIGTSIAGMIWITANFVTNQHFTRMGIMKWCSLWTFWFQLPLGCCLWMSLISLRLYRLRILYTRDEHISWWKTWVLFVPGLLFPAIAFIIVATSLKVSQLHKAGNYWNCVIKDPWKYYSYLTVPPLYFSVTLFFIFQLRRQTDFLLMSERRHTSESTMMAFMFYLLDAVIFISSNQKYAAGRCFLTFCVCWLVFTDFWVRMRKPLSLCVFKPESEMKKFEDELRWCGASFFDKVQAEANVAAALYYASRTMSIPSSQLHDGDWVLRTMDLLFSESEESQEKIEQLQQQKSRLTLKIMELEESLGLLGQSSREDGS